MNIKMNRNISNPNLLKSYLFRQLMPMVFMYWCLLLEQNFKQNYLSNIYLGQNISKKNREKTYSKLFARSKCKNKGKCKSFTDSKSLKNNEIIAVARGREEFGARL